MATNPFDEFQPATPANPFDEFEQVGPTTRQVLHTAVRTNPDDAAEVARLAKRYPGPNDVLLRSLKDVKLQEAVDKADESLKTSVKLSEYMRTSPFAAQQAHDDLGTLAQLERFATDTYGSVEAGVFNASKGAAGVFRAASELAAPVLDFLEAETPEEFAGWRGSIGGNPLRRLAEGFALQGAGAGAQAKAAAPKTEGVLEGGFQSGIQSLTQNLLALPMAFLPGGQPAALTMMTASTGGQSYQDAREKGLSMSQALPFAASQAAIEYATEKLPLAQLLGDVKAGTSFIKTLAKQVALEVPGEQVATILQDMNEWAVLNPEKPFSSYIAERPSAAAQTLVATIVGAGGNVAVAKGIETAVNAVSGTAARMSYAENEARKLQDALAVAAQSKLRERNPETFRDLAANLTDDATVFVDAQVLAQSATELAQALPAVAEQLEAAIATNSTIEIPVADILTLAPGTPLEQVFLQNARQSPDAMSLADVTQAGEQAQQFLQQEAERVMQQAQDQQAWQASSEAVKQTILDQLNQAGRFSPEVNEAYAALQMNFFSTMAARLGTTPQELYDRYSLKVAQQTPGQGNVLNAGLKTGEVEVEAFHYSKADRTYINTTSFGSGLQGSGRDTYMNAADKRLRNRAYFYFDKGTGINPEAGVGGRGHKTLLRNIYDSNADPLRLKQGRGQLEFESAVLDAGFSGYLDNLEGTQSGQVILLGPQSVPVENLGELGTTRGTVPRRATRGEGKGRDKFVDQLNEHKFAIAGEAGLGTWSTLIKRALPEAHAAMEAAGVFQGEGRFYKDGLIKRFMSMTEAQTYEQAAVERLTSAAQRGERVTGTRAVISPEEKAAIKESAEKTGISEREITRVVREHKLAHPTAQGWAPLVYNRTVLDKGKVVYEYKATPYDFSADKDGTQLAPGSTAYTRRVNAVAKSMVEEVRRVFLRAQNDDKNAQNILAQAGWYKSMRSRLRQEFGGLGDLFADLLGATSPNTPVRDNWANAVDALRRASRGDFDEVIPQWEAWSDKVDELELDFRGYVNDRIAEGLTKKAIKALPEYKAKLEALKEARKLPDNLLPTKETGKKYGFNGRNVARAMVDLWRVVKNADPDIGRGGTAPKALNFSGNLIGFRERATIDVWAARMLQRLAGGQRIPSMAETGVSGEMREDATTTLQFGFGQDVFSEAVKRIRADAELKTDKTLAEINDDDLQAVVWFVEKELWTVNNWTNAAGEGGSFELEANLSGSADQARIRELRRIVDSSKTKPADKAAAKAELAAMERTVDRFVGGLSIQMSAETQGVDFVPTDADMARLGHAIRLAAYETDDGNTVLASKTLSTEGRYGGVERSLDLEVVAREGYNPDALWLEMLRQAQATRQDSTFLSRVLRDGEDYDPTRHRPGVEIYFREAAAQDQLETVLADLAKEGVEFLTVIVDGRRLGATMEGEMPPAVGVRLQYVPEFEQRYGMDDLSGLDDAALAAKIEAKASELRALAERVTAAVDGVSFAGQFWYDTQVAFSAEYQEKIDALTTGIPEEGAGGVRGPQWAGQPVRQGLESANRQARETAGGEPDGGTVLGGDALGAYEQAAQEVTQTPEFQAWFGDSVVREPMVNSRQKFQDMKPLVVYHSTNVDFDSFEIGRETVNSTTFGDMTTARQGIFFAEDPKFAEGYGTGQGQRVMPVYLSIKNPIYLDEGISGEDLTSIVEASDGKINRNDFRGVNADEMWQVFDGDFGRNFVEAAKALGYDGAYMIESDPDTGDSQNVWVAFEPTQIKSAIGNTGAFNPNDPNILNQGPRGTFNPQTLLLTLNENADLSTFLHESGHFFLEVMADLASQPGAPQQIVDDMAATLKWFGVPDLATWNGYTLDQKRPYHERWAESFEQYLFEGKAPSAELQPLFRRFRSWMINVYKSLTAFMRGRDLKLGDDIRQVFDRLIATDEQIAQAEQAAGLMPEFDATNEAIEKLQARSLRDLKWTVGARNKAIKALQKQAAELRKGVEAEVRAEVEAQPVYAARKFLRTDTKLAIAGLEDLYMGEGDRYALLDWKPLVEQKLAGKEGLHPDLVADMFGFTSGDQLVRAILDAQPINDVIQGMTDQRMLERHGDLVDQRAIEEAANEAVHNEARARSLATELKSQSEMLNPRQDTGRTDTRGRPITVNAITAAAKEFAANLAARRRIKDLKNAAWQHRSAEARAGKAWQDATAKGDTQAAVQAKRDQVLNNAAAKALQDAQAETRKILEFFKRVAKGNDEKVVKGGRDPDVVNAMRAILGAYDIAPRLEKAALEYMETVSRNDPAMFAALQPSVQGAINNAKPLPEMTMEELRGLNDELRAMWALAKRSRQMEIDGNLLDRQDLADELLARMNDIGIPAEIPGERAAITDREEAGIKLQFAKSILSRVEQWAERMDGKFGGPFLRFVFQPIKEAADAYRTARVDYRKRFTALVENVAPAIRPGSIPASELGYTFGNSRDSGQAELLHAILHTGNDSNKRKLLLGRGWATENPDGTLDTSRWDAFIQRMQDTGVLRKEHYDFAQGVWDLLEEMKPLAQETHRNVFGRYFAEVTANAFETPFGSYRGGYVPAQTDALLVRDAKLRELAEGENETMAYAFPSAPSGFTKARVEYNKPLLLDLRALAQHIDKVLLFSYMQGPVTDVRRLLTDKGVAYALDRIDPGAYEGMLIPWLNRSARQIVETPVAGDRKLSRFLSAARSRAGMALMFANLSNTFQQITGFSMAAVKVKPSLMLKATAEFTRSPKQMKEQVAAASEFMRNRMLNEIGAMNDAIEQILVDATKLEKAQAWTREHAYFLQAAVDNTMSPIIWTAAYNQGVEQQMNHKDAVRFADGVIRQTQGTTLPEDISRFESGSAIARTFTQFVGYFNMMANTNATAAKQVIDEVGLRKGAGRLLGIALAGLLVPIWVAEAIAQAFRGGPDDEDDDGYLDDWLMAVFGLGTLRGMVAQVPIVGQMAQLAVNRFNDNPADDKFSLSPAVSLIESAVSSPASVYKAIVDEGSAQKAVRDVAAAATLITGLPIYGAARPIGYLAGVADERIEPTGPIDFTRGLVTGTASPESKQP